MQLPLQMLSSRLRRALLPLIMAAQMQVQASQQIRHKMPLPLAAAHMQLHASASHSGLGSSSRLQHNAMTPSDALCAAEHS